MSKNLRRIRDDFDKAILVNTSELAPQQAGTRETFTFSPKLVTSELEPESDGETQENHMVYVAMRTVDHSSLRSAVSNIALVMLSTSPSSAPVLSRDDLVLKGVLIAVGLVGILCLVIVAAHWTLNRRKRALKKDNGAKLLWANVHGSFLTRYDAHGLYVH